MRGEGQCSQHLFTREAILFLHDLQCLARSYGTDDNGTSVRVPVRHGLLKRIAGSIDTPGKTSMGERV